MGSIKRLHLRPLARGRDRQAGLILVDTARVWQTGGQIVLMDEIHAPTRRAILRRWF